MGGRYLRGARGTGHGRQAGDGGGSGVHGASRGGRGGATPCDACAGAGEGRSSRPAASSKRAVKSSSTGMRERHQQCAWMTLADRRVSGWRVLCAIAHRRSAPPECAVLHSAAGGGRLHSLHEPELERRDGRNGRVGARDRRRRSRPARRPHDLGGHRRRRAPSGLPPHQPPQSGRPQHLAEHPARLALRLAAQSAFTAAIPPNHSVADTGTITRLIGATLRTTTSPSRTAFASPITGHRRHCRIETHVRSRYFRRGAGASATVALPATMTAWGPGRRR